MGRAAECDQLVAGLTEAFQGRGQLFLISGEPGIGKTRMADEICAIARARGMRVLWGRCWEPGDSPPYWPWIEVLRGFISGQPPDSGSITDLLRAAAQDEDPQHLTGSVRSSLEPEEADLGRFALFEAVVQLLKKKAETSPHVIVLDDLHSADEASLQLLRFVAHSAKFSSLLLIGTYRPVEVRRNPQLSAIFAEIARDAHPILLHGLGRKDVTEFVKASAARSLDEAAVAVLYRATGGNPYFLRETLRLLVAEDRLTGTNPRSIQKIRIPDTIRGVIRRSINLIPETLKDALRTAAVIGVEFDFKLLQRVTKLPSQTLLDLLGRAIAADILNEETATHGCYRFKHSLITQTICGDLQPSERTYLHHKIASEMEDLYAADLEPHLAEIAHHYAEAHVEDGSAKTIDYLRRAARLAMDSLAYEDAVRLLSNALQIADSSGLQTDELRYQLLMDSGEARYSSGLVSQARLAFEEAGRTARKLGDWGKLARAALGRATPPTDAELDRPLVAILEEALSAAGTEDVGTRAKMLARLGSELQWSRDDRVPLLVAEALDLAKKSGDPLTQTYVFYWGYIATWSVENLEQRISNLTEAVELAELIGNKPWILKTRYKRFLSLLENCEIHRADADFARFSELTDELRLPFGWKEMASAQRALMDGRLDDAEKFALMSLEIGRRMERRFRTLRQAFNNLSLFLRREQGRIAELEPMYRSATARHPANVLVRCAFAFCLAEMNQRREATQLFEQITSTGLELIPRNLAWYATTILLAEVCVYLGDVRRAEVLYNLMAPYATRNALLDVHVCYGPIARYLGLLATTMSRFDEAEQQFEVAIEITRRMGSRQWLARALVDYASMLARRATGQDRVVALKHLDAAIEDASTYGLKALGEKAFALRASLGVPVASKHIQGARRDDKPGSSKEFKRDGEIWTITWAGKTVRLKNANGLHYIAHLLRYPGQEFHVLDMVTPGSADVEQRGIIDEDFRAGAPGDAGEMLDAQAKAMYKHRITELRQEIEEAREFNDEARVHRAEEEIDALARELSRAVGLSGRDRRAASVAERVRLNVTRAIKRAIERIAEHHAELGAMLEKTIKTGIFCSYNPRHSDADVPWDL